MYRHYIFDLYGTLADIRTDETDPAAWRALAEALGAEKWESLPDRYVALCRAEQARLERALARAGVPGPAEIDIENVWRALFPGADTKAVSALFRRLTTRRLALYPGAKALLSALRARGKTICLLTNAQASFTLPELRTLGIDGAFDHIFISSRAGVKKPSPAFFALPRRAGLPPEESLMIGNDDACDCRAAAAAGMDSLYIRTAQSPEPSGPLPENCREISALSQALTLPQLA